MFDWLSINAAQFSHFHFLRPWWGLAFIPLLGTLWYLRRARNPRLKWRKVIAPHLLDVMLIQSGKVSEITPINISVFMVIFAIIGLAGPTWKQQESPFTEDATALIVMLDVSSSMKQEDIQPSRLERAKQKVQDLLKLRPGGQAGLVVYAGSAHSVIPPTNDPDVINNFLDAIVVEMMPRKGKFPERGLAIAEKMLQESVAPGTILMIGDGVSPQSAERFQQYFSSNQHQLLVLGIGSEFTEITDDESNLIPLESNALKNLANISDGHYQELTIDKLDVSNLNRRINNYFVIVEDDSRPWVDEGYYLLFPISLLMLLWFRKGWHLHWCVALVFISSMATPQPTFAASGTQDSWHLTDKFISLWLTPDQQGKYYLNKGDFKTATVKFENIAWRGIAYYRGENFKAAAEMFSRIDTVEGYFNLANAWAHSRNYILARNAYDQVLKLDSEHVGAIKNRAIIQTIIDDINRLSSSQKAEESDSSQELSQEDPQTAEGVERSDFNEREVEQLTAEDILLDEQMNALWMEQVQRDPSRFLSVKFYRQLQLDEANNNEP